ncbi:hypothetical protein RHOSPDRAFT_31723 [Rhodotorula sp. JG-1b]|nr:hypothetical protein RHOSPDRAFT_31723 [Rhodotorula sp. JG-1b]
MTSRRLRPRATRPTPLHWLTRTAFTSLLLATVAVHASTQVRPGPALARDPDLNDILESAVWPPVPAAAAPVPDGYQLLLERARREVRLERRAEEESRRTSSQKRPGDAGNSDASDCPSSAGAASPAAENGMRVVRETFYIPRDQLGGSPHREEGSSSTVPPASGAVTPGASAPESPPADFRQTVGKLRILRPLFTYAIQHPLRFLLSYLMLPLLSLIWFLLIELVSWLLLLFYPATYLISTFVLAPLRALSSAVSALAPVLYALGGALAIGAGIGAVGGLVAAQSTRTAIDATADRTQKALRWLGVLAKDEEGSFLLDEDQGYETAFRESFADLSREAEQLAGEAIAEAEAEAEDADIQQPKNEEEEVAAAVAAVRKDDEEWQRAHAAAEARANRIEALRYRVKLEGAGSTYSPAGPSVLVA